MQHTDAHTSLRNTGVATEVNYPFFDVGVYFVRGGGGEKVVGACIFLQNAKAQATKTRKGLHCSQSTFAVRLQTEDIFLPISCTGSGGQGSQYTNE